MNTIPKVGESFTYKNLKITVTSATRTRPVEILVEVADNEIIEDESGEAEKTN